MAYFLDFNFDPLRLKSSIEKSAYLRGFFDAEGVVPRDIESRFYIQLSQKDKEKIKKLKKILHDLVKVIGSWHLRKAKIFKQRLKKDGDIVHAL